MLGRSRGLVTSAFAVVILAVLFGAAEVSAEGEVDYSLDCHSMLVSVTKRVMVELVQCVMDMKKMPRGGSGGDCAIKCGMKRLKLLSENSERISDKDVTAFVSYVSKPQYVEIAKVIIGGCLEEFDALPDDKLSGKCEPYVDLLKCMQATLIEFLYAEDDVTEKEKPHALG